MGVGEVESCRRVGQAASDGSGGVDGVKPDGVAEGVGLSDDAAHGAFWVESREVVAAEVVVADVVGEHVPGRMIECSTATMAFF